MVCCADAMTVVTGKTRLVGIIGYPVRHSLSPAMQNAAFAACGLDYLYVPFEVIPERLVEAVAGLRALGVCGFNVTIPYKTAIIPYLDQLDPGAEEAGAVNTVLIRDGRLIGYNTDGDGLVDALTEELAFTPGSGEILVIGAGGAARGAVAALCRSGSGRITVANRSLASAMALQQEMQGRYPGVELQALRLDQLSREHLSAVALLLNTTSLGMKGERLEFMDVSVLPEHAGVYDMVYSADATPLVAEAASRGLRAVDGLSMLAAQGERAFSIWTGQIPPKGLMKQVLQGLCHR